MKKYTYQDLIDFFEDQEEVQNALAENANSLTKEYSTNTSLSGLLHGLFVWERTPQGYEYWDNLCRILLDYERQNPGE